MNEQTALQNEATDRELLSFRVGEQEYSVDIMSVREIRGWTRPTPIPHSADYVRGVINLRGTVLPIVDLARRLDLSVEEACERNVIIVSKIRHQTVGLLVDAVSDILAIPDSEMQPPPEMTEEKDRGFVKALTIVDGRMLRVLDLETVLPEQSVEAV
ncbi:chemotaxis protein CheW [Aliiruegeria sabulilitoris]|uniref:chemotaxis protein CheW n=1 Tax=Aliiruegeria sabulilitoris TaxID=1510458 RepID=UPI0009E6AB14|nr:chemotaxis protein CheW [Aliiruegeria sabulilitoris]NDR58102.1 purine-binding chemotaxis protein CheW [Pseudoruegeria sp. M32A2M]